MKPKRRNCTYNPVLLLFYTIMRMIFFPIYLTGKIIEILSTLIVPASATLYLIFLVYDDRSVWLYDAGSSRSGKAEKELSVRGSDLRNP